MKDAMIIGLLLLLGALFALRDGREPRLAVEAAPVGMVQPAQAVTNPRGQARVTLRVAPCVTIDPQPLQFEDKA
jgi:hypothetical protein